MRLSACPYLSLSLSLSLLVLPIRAIELDLEDNESIKKAASIVAADMTSYYTGDDPGDVPGNLPQPYYWWEAGAMFGALIDYWFYTGDDTYNDLTMQGLLHQASPTRNFMPENQTHTEGNDDQGFWGIAAMMAAERKFPNPPSDEPQWLELAQGVFNSQAARWNTDACGAGLKWQITPLNKGYEYRNSISNGCFFNIAARLALYTGNSTYAEEAEKTWDWMTGVGLMTDDMRIYDGASESDNCTSFDEIQWTYNAGVFLHGAAAMYRYTNDSVWGDRVQDLVDGLSYFFYTETDIMYEQACEGGDICNTDQRSFKAYLARWMGATTQLAPFTAEQLMPKLAASAQGAAKACTGGPDGTECGLKWDTGEYDGRAGVGEQMCALEVIQANLVEEAEDPVTEETGGNSTGDPGAGMDSPFREPKEPEWVDDPITMADRVGAGLLTGVLCIAIASGSYWVMIA